MIVNVRVIPKASRVSVTPEGAGLKVRLTKPARDGLANAQLIEALAEYYGVKKYRVWIRTGEAARNKIVEIVDE